MKKILIALITTVMMLSGCASHTSKSSSSEPSVEYKESNKDAYTAYSDSIAKRKDASSWSAAVQSVYKMNYSDNTNAVYQLDGTLDYMNPDDPTAHIQTHIERSDGLTLATDGYYYGGRLYNTYNNVDYYEDMSEDQLKQSMLVPMDPYAYEKSQIEKIKAEDGSDGSVRYTYSLNKDTAETIFTSRYDSYGLNSFDSYSVTDNTITDSFDKDGHFTNETADFTIEITVQDQKVKITFHSSVNYLKFDQTEVKISDDLKKKQSAYVNYKDIDTDAIASDSTAVDDSEESTVTATLKKRLVNREGYKVQDDGTYLLEFNENERYIFDFDNDTFTYSNYTIKYIYSWKSNTASMGACTYEFNDKRKSSDCDDKTIDMMNTVEQYFEMELYYCGVSASDLEAETR